MTRYDGRNMATGRQAVQGGLSSQKQTLATQVWVNDSVLVADTLYFGKLPKGAVVTGGRLFGGRLASGGSAGCSSLSLVLGWDVISYSASGTSYGVASGTSALGVFSPIEFNPGPYSSVPGCGQRWESGFSVPIGGVLQIAGPLTTQADGNVFATITTSAGTGSGVSAYLNLELDYYTGTYT